MSLLGWIIPATAAIVIGIVKTSRMWDLMLPAPDDDLTLEGPPLHVVRTRRLDRHMEDYR